MTEFSLHIKVNKMPVYFEQQQYIRRQMQKQFLSQRKSSEKSSSAQKTMRKQLTQPSSGRKQNKKPSLETNDLKVQIDQYRSPFRQKLIIQEQKTIYAKQKFNRLPKIQKKDLRKGLSKGTYENRKSSKIQQYWQQLYQQKSIKQQQHLIAFDNTFKTEDMRIEQAETRFQDSKSRAQVRRYKQQRKKQQDQQALSQNYKSRVKTIILEIQHRIAKDLLQPTQKIQYDFYSKQKQQIQLIKRLIQLAKQHIQQQKQKRQVKLQKQLQIQKKSCFQRQIQSLQLKLHFIFLQLAVNRLQLSKTQLRYGLQIYKDLPIMQRTFDSECMKWPDARKRYIRQIDLKCFILTKLYPLHYNIFDDFAAHSKIYQVMFGQLQGWKQQDIKITVQLFKRKVQLYMVAKKVSDLRNYCKKFIEMRIKKIILICQQFQYKQFIQTIVQSINNFNNGILKIQEFKISGHQFNEDLNCKIQILQVNYMYFDIEIKSYFQIYTTNYFNFSHITFDRMRKRIDKYDSAFFWLNIPKYLKIWKKKQLDVVYDTMKQCKKSLSHTPNQTKRR